MSYGLATIVVRKNYDVLQRSYTTLRYLFLTPTVRMYAYIIILNIQVINVDNGALGGPIPSMLTAVTMTTTVPVNTLSGSNGAVNVSVVVELSAFIIVPL